jgi:hypothetical protein
MFNQHVIKRSEKENLNLFVKKLDKVYNSSDPLYDPEERNEEMNRMREHVMREMDTNGDHIISLEEFLKGTEKKEFDQNEEWKVNANREKKSITHSLKCISIILFFFIRHSKTNHNSMKKNFKTFPALTYVKIFDFFVFSKLLLILLFSINFHFKNPDGHAVNPETHQ